MEEKIYEFDPQVYPMKLWVMKTHWIVSKSAWKSKWSME